MTHQTIAYLISQYPAVSHTFILREVRRLRILGLPIKTASINRPDRLLGELDADEAEEAENTFYIKEKGFLQAFSICVRLLATSPLKFFKGIKTVFTLAGWDIQSLVKHFAYFGESALLGAWMEINAIKHVHVHFANPASTVALITSSLYPITFSMTVHGPDEFYNATLNHLPEKIIHAKFIICISYYAQSQLMRFSSLAHWNKFQVVNLGVDPDIFTPHFEPVRVHPCQILCVGRLVPSKGQQILIAAFHRLIQSGKDIRLRFIGDGENRGELESEVVKLNLQNKVHFSGALNPLQVLEAYKQTDIFALASFAEGLPVVLMEAMSMEIPCIATCINGIPEIIRHNTEGLLVAPSNIIQLAQTLELLVEDYALRKRLGKAGRCRIQESYNLETNVRTLYNHFIVLLQ